jgi:hypothetical protein
VSEWMPIETLPADVRRFLGWCVFPAGAEARMIDGRRDEIGNGAFYAYGCRQDVTHWMPLPEPPLSATPDAL